MANTNDPEGPVFSADLFPKRHAPWHDWVIKFPSPDLYVFSRAYEQAADLLVDSLDDKDSGGILSIPIIHLYRHPLETSIKNILTCFGEAQGIDPQAVRNRSHQLEDQLADLTTIAEHAGEPLTNESRGFIQKIHAEDPKGMKARYPTSKDGKEDLLKNIDSFHLAPFTQDARATLNELYHLTMTLHLGPVSDEY